MFFEWSFPPDRSQGKSMDVSTIGLIDVLRLRGKMLLITADTAKPLCRSPVTTNTITNNQGNVPTYLSNAPHCYHITTSSAQHCSIDMKMGKKSLFLNYNVFKIIFCQLFLPLICTSFLELFFTAYSYKTYTTDNKWIRSLLTTHRSGVELYSLILA